MHRIFGCYVQDHFFILIALVLFEMSTQSICVINYRAPRHRYSGWASLAHGGLQE